jgi:hypothetical protein
MSLRRRNEIIPPIVVLAGCGAAVAGDFAASVFSVQICWWINFNPSSTSFMRQQLSVQQKNPMRSYSINGCRITAFPRI